MRVRLPRGGNLVSVSVIREREMGSKEKKEREKLRRGGAGRSLIGACVALILCHNLMGFEHEAVLRQDE